MVWNNYRAQNQTLNIAGIIIRKPYFSHDDTKKKSICADLRREDYINVVYKEII